MSLNPYRVRPRHVQTALKLSRLGNIHQEYLENLMTPYCQPDKYDHLQYYAAVPKIISGGYFLRKEWIFKSAGGRHFADVHWQIRRATLVCFHMIIAFKYSSLKGWHFVEKNRFQNTYSSTPFDKSFWDAACNVRKEFKGTCAGCSDRTEYSILCPDKYTMVIRAWYDYGTETHNDWASIWGFMERMRSRGASSRSIREIFNE